MYSFEKITCDWIGEIHDCYILHSKSLHHISMPFSNVMWFQLLCGKVMKIRQNVRTSRIRYNAFRSQSVQRHKSFRFRLQYRYEQNIAHCGTDHSWYVAIIIFRIVLSKVYCKSETPDKISHIVKYFVASRNQCNCSELCKRYWSSNRFYHLLSPIHWNFSQVQQPDLYQPNSIEFFNLHPVSQHLNW